MSFSCACLKNRHTAHDRCDIGLKCHCEEKLCFDAGIQCALAASVSGQWIATRPLAIRDDGVVFD